MTRPQSRGGAVPVTAPKPNAELAYRVLDHIDAHPEQWNQEFYIGKTERGTAACFAGWACLLSGEEPAFSLWDLDSSTPYLRGPERSVLVPDRAEQLLRAGRYVERRDGEEDDDDLFDANNTREDLGRLVAEIFGPRPESYGSGCRCDWLGEGTPEHDPSPLCRNLRPDAARSEQ